jgi:hypothetical protein
MPPTVHEEEKLMRTMLVARVAVTVVAVASGCQRPLPTSGPVAPGQPVTENGPPVAGCTPPGPLAAPAALPESLRPPAGARLFLRLRAEGKQIYRCQQNPAGAWAFTLKAPDARLISDRCTEVGHHFAGPSWSLAGDGSVVVGKKLAEAPTAGTIPWLLLSGTSASPGGTMTSVRFIQRVDTAGGVAPVEGCDEARAGQEVGVPYSATYLYYETLTGSHSLRDGTPAAKLPAAPRHHYRGATLPLAAVSNSRS